MKWFFCIQLTLSMCLIGHARADISVYYAAYAASTPAFKTNWQDGRADLRGFAGNFAKTQSLSAALADLSYQDISEAALRDDLWKLGFRMTKEIHKSYNSLGRSGDASAIVVRDLLARVSIVAIRGTDDQDDAINDLMLVPSLSGGSPNYHLGFSLQAAALDADVQQELSPNCAPSSSRPALWFVGHSLGGAAGSILAHKFNNERGCKVNGAATFGSPRVATGNWQSTYGGPGEVLYYSSHRWVNDKDPAYCMPPGGQWKHVGLESRIFDSGAINVYTSLHGSVCATKEQWIDFMRFTLDPAQFLGTAIHGAVLECGRD